MLDKKIQGSGLNFHHVNKLSIKCIIVNEPKGSSCIKSPDWLKCKNGTINPEVIDDECFQYALKLTQHQKETKSHPERASSIKQFI